MGFSAKAGKFDGNASSGNQAVTGIGFQPKLLILTSGGVSNGGEGSTSGARFLFGAASGTSNRFAGCLFANSNQNPSLDKRVFKSTKILSRTSDGSTIDHEGDFTSFDSDGFTINWSTALARELGYIALGGSDLSAQVGTFNINTSTGNQSITGVGFRPSVVIFYHVLSNTTDGITTAVFSMIGFGVSASSRAVTQIVGSDAVTPSIEKGIQLATECLHHESTGVVTFTADFVSQDSDGFTINVTTAPGVSSKIGYIALGGINVKLGVDTQKTSTGTKATTGVGFRPSVILLAGQAKVNGSTLTADAKQSFGAASGPSDRFSQCMANNNNKAASETSKRFLSTACLSHVTPNGPSATTLNAEADLSSLDSDGFTLNWGTADGTAREFIYLALAAMSAAARLPTLALLGAG